MQLVESLAMQYVSLCYELSELRPGVKAHRSIVFPGDGVLEFASMPPGQHSAGCSVRRLISTEGPVAADLITPYSCDQLCDHALISRWPADA